MNVTQPFASKKSKSQPRKQPSKSRGALMRERLRLDERRAKRDRADRRSVSAFMGAHIQVGG